MKHTLRPLLKLRSIQGFTVGYSSRVVNYYEVLGLDSKATQSQIKNSFYKLSLIHHPDKNPSSTSAAKFQNISEAYEILGNYKTRVQYDRGLIHPQSHTDERAPKYDDPVNYNFYKRRTVKQPIMRNQETIYNFDEFYRQHYSASIRGSRFDKEQLDMRRVEINSGISTFMSLMLLSIIMVVGYSINNANHNDGIERPENLGSRKA